ncbi:PREDICTED: uncharacterized protein LOC105567228, partial [Vollenhovia emeryi]|uniref:uncharacterized protein LOC105567228 n=1 Tax=Vollenhovia emeryi TaxID=411798 RepID=UPI0005F407DE
MVYVHSGDRNPVKCRALLDTGSTANFISESIISRLGIQADAHSLPISGINATSSESKGWVLAGSTTLNDSPKSFLCGLTSLESQIAKFWTIEEITTIKPKSEEEIKCEAHFVKNTIRDITGRYVVRLPFRESINRLGDSQTVALKRFSALERKFHGNESMKNEYTRVMDEYISLGHMSVVKNPDDVGFYMPHHAVVKESSCTTKLRVVVDASAKSNNNTSLNDLLMTGPTIQDTLFAYLIRFRKYRYVITADIEKMYRQVLVHEDDRRFQRILWRKAGKIETFQLNTLTFGVSSSPFLAIRTIQKLADDECYIYPRAAEVLKNHLYVDDLLSGAETLKEIRKIRDDIIALLKKGGFAIRQWASNNSRAIDDLSDNALHANFVLDGDYSLKTLGISWSTRDDKICYTTQPIKITGMVTKRKILSEIAKLFDPLGLLGPVILHANRLMQDVWRCGTHWDESVPQSLHTEWSEFVQQLDSI